MDMKRMMNRWIALLVALAMLLGGCLALAEGEAAESAQEAVATAKPQATEAPDVTGETEQREADEAAQEPEDSEESQLPEDAELPEATPAPELEPDADEADMPAEALAAEAVEIDALAEEEDALNGTTDPVDNSTTLADGTYAPEGFSFSGGTGKTTISCSEVIVSGGKSFATIAFSSKNYSYVKASGGKYDDVKVVDGKSTFTIPVKLNADNRIIGMTTAMSKSTEVEYTIRVTLTESAEPEETEAPGYEDGDYDFGIESGYKMFKIASSTAKVSDGKITVTIVTGSTTYDRIYLGSKDDADKSSYVQGVLNSDGTGYVLTFALPESCMGKAINFVPGKPDGTWYLNNQYTLTIPETLGDKIEDPEEPEDPGAPEEPGDTVVPDDGDYSVEVESSASMFRVVKAVLTAKGGKYTAVITLSGTGYDKLFMGTKEQAEAASASEYIDFVPDADGMYTYTISVPALDVPFDVAAHSIKNDTWYDRQLTFKSSTLQKIGDSATTNPDPTATPTPAPTQAPEADLSGSTSKVNNSTGLADGTYTPDSFSFSGGTGKVRISCPKITVSGGKVTATIVFSSSNYTYVKANGRKYYGSNSGGKSTFEIPVTLNANNKIIGMTTAMSTPHEVEYTIYIGLKAAKESGESTGDGVPEIAGLSYQATDAIASAKLFKIYRFDGGIAEISVEGVGDYLVYDAGAVLPAGIEESVILIERPVENAYLALPEMCEFARQLGAVEPVKLAGFADDTLTFAGEYTAPEYSALLFASCDLAIMPAAFAVAEGEELDPALAEVKERLEMLGIPMFVDRSADEETEEARLEWRKVYAVLFNCEAALAAVAA